MKSILIVFLFLFPLLSFAQDCRDVPKDAVLKIEGERVATWAKIVCTKYGHIITFTPEYGFMGIKTKRLVNFPAQLAEASPKKGEKDFYFTSISVKQLTGSASEFMHGLHQKNIFYSIGQDVPKETPKLWELEAITSQGKELGIYFYEYSDIVLGSSCWESCNPTKGFIVLKKPKMP